MEDTDARCCGCGCASGDSTAHTARDSFVRSVIDRESTALTALSDAIWSFGELGLVEHKSAAALAAYLSQHGFSVDMGVAGMETAFVATWGTGTPVIGFLGEYDALPGVSNKPVAYIEPVKPGATGHGCGHNLLGVAAAAGAVALKEYALANGIPGTVKYFGCPAEESSFGKTWMVKAGLFDGVDIALTWHPGNINGTDNSSSLADLVYKFNFHGKTAHAAGDPWNGRSALDAVELMNDGIERMREHIHPDCRIHYVISNGGKAPNVVPDFAQNFFDIRAANMEELDVLHEWVQQIAQGAALMTQTKCEPLFLGGAANLILNTVITGVFQDIMERLGAPTYTSEEMRFAEEMQRSFTPASIARAIEQIQKRVPVLNQTLICDFIAPADPEEKPGKGSTDVADVSWVVPTGQFRAACFPIGAPGHSWAVTSSCGMSIGHKGMLFASKVLGLAGIRFLTEEPLRIAATEEFKKRLGGKKYRSPIPEGIDTPPLPFEEN